MILNPNRAVLVASVICFQKIFGLHGLNHQIIEYWDSRGRYWLVLGGTGSEQGGTGYFVMVLGKYRALMPSYNEVEDVVGCHLSRNDRLTDRL